MARRASSNHHPLAWAIVAGFAALAGGGGFFFFKEPGDPFRTLPKLDVPTYMENALSLRGNSFKMQASVQNAMAWSPGQGRLISVEVQDTGEVLPVLVPAEFNHINLQKGQRFYFKFEVVEKGVILVKGLEKS